jgi:alanine racemase
VSARATAVIDLGAFRSNVTHLAALVFPARTMLAVKANAYGHGMQPLAHAALEAGADSLAVLDVPAGLTLRDAGITAPLFAWLHGVNTDFAAAAAAQLELGISASWQIAAIRAAAPGSGVRVHLKIDTGLSRNGASVEDWPELVLVALDAAAAGDVTIAGAWSHLADASPEEDERSLARLLEAVAVAESLGCEFPLLHLAASSAGIRLPEARLGLVRFGIAAYGVSPFDDASGDDLGLTPVMTLRSTISAVDGDSATVSIGFGDGVAAPGIPGAEVLVAGERRRIRSIDVDSLVIDAAGSPISIGDQVVVFGTGDDGAPTAEEWAAWADTNGDEIVVRVADRVARDYVDPSTDNEASS